MAFSFGVMSTIDGNVSTMAFILTIVFLILFDSATNAWEASLRGSVIYNSMLQKIYKELMMMGFVSFGVAMYQASITSQSEKMVYWIEAADFVGYIIFFVTIFFVIHALYIMFLSMTVSRRYADLDKTSISDILVEFKTAKQSSFNMFLMKFCFFPVLNVLKNVEFKIGWAVFRDTYVLPSQFDYVDYASGSLQRYALRLVDIDKTSWLFLVVLVLINYFRMLVFDHKCRSGFTTEDLEDEAVRDRFDVCESQHRFMFHLSGAFLVLYVVGLFVIGRLYQFRIIGRAGVLGVDDYENFLIFEEASLVQHEQKKMKESTSLSRIKRQRKSSVTMFKNAMDSFLRKQQHTEKELEEEKQKSWHRKLFVEIRRPLRVSASPAKTSASDESNASMDADSLSVMNIEPTSTNGDGNFSPARKAVIDRLQNRTRKYFMKFKEKQLQKPVKLVRKDVKETHIKFSEDMSEIFFLSSPFLFFKSVEFAILMNSLYLSIWFCNYMTSTPGDFTASILKIIPIFVCLPVIGEIVKIASLIDCTATLNLDVVGTIIEDLEEKQQLKNDMQKRLKKLIMSNDECIEMTNKLFTELSLDERLDDINVDGFRQILSSLNIHFSNRKFRSVMRHVDLNTNGIINRHELNQFLFPDEEAQFQIMRRDNMNRGHQASAASRSHHGNILLRSTLKTSSVVPLRSGSGIGSGNGGSAQCSEEGGLSLSLETRESRRKVTTHVINALELEGEAKLEDFVCD